MPGTAIGERGKNGTGSNGMARLHSSAYDARFGSTPSTAGLAARALLPALAWAAGSDELNEGTAFRRQKPTMSP
jgi:hypothetical protein